MSFEVSADAYARFMGRYADPLAVAFVDRVGVVAGVRALDVGCGPGALTAALIEQLGVDAVSAIDPSESFVAAARARLPGLDVRTGEAEALPFADSSFDLTCAQLVVHFMDDPVAGLREMRRVTRPGGLVGATVWDYGTTGGPLAAFWQSVNELDPGAGDESRFAGARDGHLAELFTAAGLADVESGSLTVRSGFADFDSWWEPLTLGVGPAGVYVGGLDEDARQRLRACCASRLPATGPFEITAVAWLALARR